MISANIAQQIQESLCQQILVKAVSESRFTVDIPLWYPDGDQCRIYVDRKDDGSWALSDGGSSVMRAAYESNVNVLAKGHQKKFSRILEFYKLTESEGEVKQDSTAEIGDSIFALAQASLDIVQLARLPKEGTRQKNAGQFTAKLLKIASSPDIPGELTKDWFNGSKDPDGLYPVTLRLEKPQARPIFVFGANTEKKCMQSTISCMFHRKSIKFLAVAVYDSTANIAQMERQRLNNEVDKWFPDLSESEEISDFLKTAA